MQQQQQQQQQQQKQHMKQSNNMVESGMWDIGVCDGVKHECVGNCSTNMNVVIIAYQNTLQYSLQSRMYRYTLATIQPLIKIN